MQRLGDKAAESGAVIKEEPLRELKPLLQTILQEQE